MKKYFTCALILCWLLPLQLFAQQEDITGMWYGELTIIDTQDVRLPFEIAVSEEKGKLFGYSRIVFHVNGKDEAGVQNMSIRRKGDKIEIEDEGFITYNFSINPSRQVKKRMSVVITTTATEMIMEGSWNTNVTRYNRRYKGVVLLKRKIDFKELELFHSLDTLQLASTLSFLNRPETEAVVAVAAPVEKKPEPLHVVPEPDPVLIVASIEKASPGSLAVTKEIQSPTAKIPPPIKPKNLKMDSALIAPKSVPVVVIAASPTPEKKMPPPPKREPEKKPAVVAIQPEPEKKTPPPPQPKPEPEKPAVVAVQPQPEKKTPPPPRPKPEPEKKPAVVAVQPPPKPAPPPVAIVAPSVVHGAAEIEKRVTKLDQSFYFESDSLLLTLYDNGEVDGDTVTILMNGNVIFPKAGLNTTANSKTIYITPGMDSVNLVMYAENLGTIAPNTGLMIVNDGKKRYEVRFTADLQTNAAIVLRRRKNE